MEHEGDGDTNCGWCTWNIGKETGRLVDKSTSKDHSDYSIDKIGKNTKKNPGDFRRFAVTQTLVRNHQLTLL